MGFNVIFRGGVYIGGLRSLDNRCFSWVQERLGFSRGQAPPDAEHLKHGGGDEVKDGGDKADGQPGIEEEDGQGQAD